MIADDDGPGEEKSFCELQVYIADRNEAPSLEQINQKLTWKTNGFDGGPITLGYVNVTDPDELQQSHGITVQIYSYIIDENLNDQTLPNAFDIVEWKNYNLFYGSDKKTYRRQGKLLECRDLLNMLCAD